MGKSKRKRKLKEEDFKKKKLKVGKRLPMPDNVTKTSFKARSINIVQQTANQDGGGGEPMNFKLQTLKDLLSSCSHYNTQAREEALVGLRHLIEKYPNVLKDNLNNIFQRILDKITDIESSVRRALLSLIWSIFTTLLEAEIAPFFPSVVAYLCSAMTHLNEGVRLDSMKLLDHCLHYYPRLLSANSKNIILNFMDVISSEKGGQGISKNAGMLSLKAKVTSQKTQLEVLTRLNHLLHVIFSVYHDVDGGSSDGHGGCGVGHGDGRYGGGSHSGGGSVGQHDGGVHGINTNTSAASVWPFPVSTFKDAPTTNEVILVSDFSLKSASGGSSVLHTSPVDLLGNEVKLMEFIASLSPVLFEYWIECCPAEFSMNLIPVKKTSISLQIMREVLEIFVTLIGSLEKIISDQELFLKFLKEKLFTHFYGHFVSVFPMSFTIQHAGSKKGKKDEGNQNVSDVSLNLLICQLLTYFIPDVKQDDSRLPRWVTEVVGYLSEILVCKATGNSSQSQMTLTDIKSLTKLVKVLVVSMPGGTDDLKVKLLKSVFQLFTATHAMSNTKKVLLQFLEEILGSLAHHEMSTAMKSTLDDWLCSLLKIVNNKDLSLAVVHNVFSVCKSGILQRFPNIGAAIKDVLPSIFKPETFKRFGEETQLLVVEVLYHLQKAPSRQLYEVLSILCNSGTLSLKVFQYLMQVLHQVSPPDVSNQVHGSSVADYLSFLLSVLVGGSQKKLARLQTQKKFSNSYCHPVSKDNTLVTDPKEYYCHTREDTQDLEALMKSWKYQKSMTNIICQHLVLSGYSGKIPEMMEPSLSKLFGQYPTLPLPVAYRLLCLLKTLLSLSKENHNEGHSNPELLVYTAQWCAVIWHFALSLNPDSKHREFFKVIAKDLKQLTGELCKISCNTLQSMLDLFLTYTSSTVINCTLTCQVLTDMLKAPLKDLRNVCQSSLKSLHKNLENAFNAGMVDSQIFSDFKYHSLSTFVFSKM